MTAEAWIIGLHLWSSHFGACYESPAGCRPYESATTGIYLRAPSGLTIGAYRNSYGGDSAYAGWTFETSDGRFALMVGAVTGYHRAPVLPVVVPSMRIELGQQTALRASFIPKVEKKGANVLHLAIERQW